MTPRRDPHETAKTIVSYVFAFLILLAVWLVARELIWGTP